MEKAVRVKALAKALFFTLLQHIALGPAHQKEEQSLSLDNVHFAVYQWVDEPGGDEQTAQDIVTSLCNSLQEGGDELQLMLDQAAEANIELPAKFKIVLEKIQEHLKTHGESNVHVMGKKTLDMWLIPTLRVVPRLLEAIEE